MGEYLELKAFRNYVSDLLKAIAERHEITVDYRYSEIINPKKKDNRTGDEIALEVIRNAGLRIKGNDTI